MIDEKNLTRSKRAFFKFVVSKDLVTENDFEELKMVSSKAFQYGKANTNARFREHVIEENGILCCEYCGDFSLKHNNIRTRGTLEDFLTHNTRFFYGKSTVMNPATVDHINPISLGGDVVDYDNLAISCSDCNVVKDSKTFSEWETYMAKYEEKYDHFFTYMQNDYKYIKARDFEPKEKKHYTFIGNVAFDRDDLTSYLKFRLGEKHEGYCYRVLSSELLTTKYMGAENRPSYRKRKWVDNTGKIVNLKELKLHRVKKMFSIVEDDELLKLYCEIHNFELSERAIDKWRKFFIYLINEKDTTANEFKIKWKK